MISHPALPKISLVTPSYNQALYLDDAIQSILNQKYPDLEYFVMDGGSSDQSASVIQQYESEISYWQSEKDGGQSNAISSGFARATGEIIGWINSDDALFPGALHAVGEHFANNPGTDVLIGSVAYSDQDGRITSCHSYSPPTKKMAQRGAIAFAQQSMFFRRSAFDKIGGLRDDLHFLMDTDLVYRMIFSGLKIRTISPVLAMFRWHPDMKSINREGRKSDETLSLFENYGVDPAAVGSSIWKNRIKRLITGSYAKSLFWTLRYRGKTIHLIWTDKKTL